MSEKKKSIMSLSRRKLLASALQGGAAVVFYPSGIIRAAETKKRFVLYLHCGSWDGLSAGLLQPPDAGNWPRGLFARGADTGSNNPLVNQLKKSGRMVFHNYNSCLAELVPHMCAAVGSSQTVGHEEGQYLQATGGRKGSPNPSWIAGAAEMFSGSEVQALIVGAPGIPTYQTYVTPRVGLMNGSSVDQFNQSFVDIPAIGGGDLAKGYWDVLRQLNAMEDQTVTYVPDNVRASLNAYLTNLTSGVAPIPAAVKTDVEGAINAAVVDKIIDAAMGNKDAAATKTIKNVDVRQTFNRASLLSQIQLAACLMKTGTAYGMSISLDGQDLHFGGSSVYSARSGALTFAHIVALWRWIVKNGMADDVMIVMSHDFTRSVYNNNSFTHTIQVNGADQKVVCPGTDHHTVMGMLVLNGKMGEKTGLRLGGLTENFGVAGSDNANGTPKAAVAPFRSVDIVGSLMMRCFPDLFPNARSVTNVWKSFKEPISYVV